MMATGLSASSGIGITTADNDLREQEYHRKETASGAFKEFDSGKGWPEG